MASLLAPQDPRFLAAEEFPQIDVGAELRAGLDAGGSRMRAGGSREPARAQDEIFPAPGVRPRGGGCRAQGPGMAVATYDRSVRYPDVTVEALSPGTREHDLRVIKEG
ncbi:hypothetical protein KZ813_10460 [Sphingomonas sp. RHCKR7]|uniref:hypothetical protein n=1 Tax=Sphingomonas folli TaxID=2862497 RepID=UPI001CA4FFF8|nr:hypothetical protein [Sphingomonas folli]MBW6527261.1 hypothetical protein [Sphingomonas folli]